MNKIRSCIIQCSLSMLIVGIVFCIVSGFSCFQTIVRSKSAKYQLSPNNFTKSKLRDVCRLENGFHDSENKLFYVLVSFSDNDFYEKIHDDSIYYTQRHEDINGKVSDLRLYDDPRMTHNYIDARRHDDQRKIIDSINTISYWLRINYVCKKDYESVAPLDDLRCFKNVLSSELNEYFKVAPEFYIPLGKSQGNQYALFIFDVSPINLNSTKFSND